MKKMISLILAIMMILSLAACGGAEKESSASNASAGTDSSSTASVSPGSTSAETEADVPDPVTDTDITAEEATGDFSLTTEDGAFTQEGSIYTVTAAGTYVLTGYLEGQIVVEAGEDDEVVLELSGTTITYGKDSPIKILSAGSVAKMAQLTADEIYDIRDSRNALLRGEADNTPKDGQQLKLMLDGLDKQSFALESLFKGQTLSSTEVFSFDYDPKPAAQADSSTSIPSRETRSILFRFSKKMGLVDADDLSGDPYFITITPLGTLPSEAEDPAVKRKQTKMEKGVWVNQPQRCRITISSPSQILLTTELSLAQWGTTTLLSDILFNKQPETRLILHQTTGSVKHLTGPRP